MLELTETSRTLDNRPRRAYDLGCPEPHNDPTVPRNIHAVDISGTMRDGQPVYKHHGPLNN